MKTFVLLKVFFRFPISANQLNVQSLENILRLAILLNTPIMICTTEYDTGFDSEIELNTAFTKHQPWY